jgi:hypothetical protein
MKSPWAFLLGVVLASGSIVGVVKYRHAHATAIATTPADPMTPVPEKYTGIHQAIIEAEKQNPPGVLFIGDSITDFWRTVPWIWEESFGKLHPVNAGIAWDQTQHVMWRIQNGELDDIHPRVVVLLIGTNNFSLGHDDVASVSSGIFRVGGEIRKRLPDTKLLILGIFPRKDYSAQVSQCNAIIRGACAADGNVTYLDVGASIPPGDFPDGLHPDPDGYRAWAKAMLPTLEKLYNDGPTSAPADPVGK